MGTFLNQTIGVSKQLVSSKAYADGFNCVLVYIVCGVLNARTLTVFNL